VNQTARYVQAKTEKPQNQYHNENRPKHIGLLRSLERSLKCENQKNSPMLARELATSRTLGKTSARAA
jgi:hypothetical protein